MNRKLDVAAGIVKEVLDKSILRHSGAGRNPAISEYWIPASVIARQLLLRCSTTIHPCIYPVLRYLHPSMGSCAGVTKAGLFGVPDSQYIRCRNNHPAATSDTTPMMAMGQYWSMSRA